MNNEKQFVPGVSFKKPRETAPSWVILEGSLKVESLLDFLQNKTGWVNFQIKEGKSGKLYAEVNTWKKPAETDFSSFDEIPV